MDAELCLTSRIWAPWIAMVLVTIGWVINHHLAKARDTRKELRSSVDNFISLAKDLHKEAVEYHTAQAHDHQKATRIKSTLNLMSLIFFYEAPLNLNQDFTEQFAELRKSITLKNFDDSEFKKTPSDHPRIKSIARTTDLCVTLIEKAFAQTYYPQKKT